MYQCKSCGEKFPYPKIVQEESDEQAYSTCPKCGSDVIAQIAIEPPKPQKPISFEL